MPTAIAAPTFFWRKLIIAFNLFDLRIRDFGSETIGINDGKWFCIWLADVAFQFCIVSQFDFNPRFRACAKFADAFSDSLGKTSLFFFFRASVNRTDSNRVEH